MFEQVREPGLPTRRYYSLQYPPFKGLDLRSARPRRDDGRSPDMLNMYCEDGALLKRRGWRVLQSLDGAINGLYKRAEGDWLLHAGSALYKLGALDGTAVPQRLTRPDGSLLSVADGRSAAVGFADKLWLLDGEHYLCYDGQYAADAAAAAYAPYTSIGGCDDGSSPYQWLTCHAGAAHQPVNMLTARRRNSFITRSWLAANAHGNEERFGDKILYFDAPASAVHSVRFRGAERSDWYTVSDSRGIVGIESSAAYFSDSAGAPDWEVEFSAVSGDRAGEIEGCRVISIYSNRLFFAAHPDAPNKDWCSELNDPTYVPDLGYTEIGGSAPIMGYMRLGDSQLIVKGGGAQDAEIFLREGSLSAGYGDMLFTVRQGIAGSGAVSRYCFANLLDDTLFFSRDGVCAVASHYINAERVLQQRSSFVAPLLCGESGMEEAVACVWRGWYMLFLNGRVYIADSRGKCYTNNSTGTYEYEWYLWDNVPARVVYAEGESLFFGTAAGELCRFNTDMYDDGGSVLPEAFADGYDMRAAEKAPCPVRAHWYSRCDDDGSFTRCKTLPRRGCGVYLKSYPSSSADVFCLTDEEPAPGRHARADASRFDFSRLDFGDFSFATAGARVAAFNQRVRRYKTIRLGVANERINEGLGIYGAERRYYIDGWAE